MKNSIIYLGLIGLLLITSCDTIEKENFLADTNPVDTTSNETVVQKALIEDFTGHGCSSCPQASTEIEVLQNFHGNKLIAIGVHSGSFAQPQTGTAFTTDFRTSYGNEIHDLFSPSGYPVGVINRRGYPGNALINYGYWSAELESVFSQTPQAAITMNESDGQIIVEARSTNGDLDGLKLVVCITENGIIDWQINGSEIQDDYIHNHVLRTHLNGTWGDEISLTTTNSTFTFDYTLENNWVKENCHAIAYIYNITTYEIIQVEEIHL